MGGFDLTAEHFQQAFYGNATMHDLFACWERSAGVDLTAGFRVIPPGDQVLAVLQPGIEDSLRMVLHKR